MSELSNAREISLYHRELCAALQDAYEAQALLAREHAAKCRDCYIPIVDEEGNPKFLGEACAEGARLLQAYMDAEKALFACPKLDSDDYRDNRLTPAEIQIRTQLWQALDAAEADRACQVCGRTWLECEIDSPDWDISAEPRTSPYDPDGRDDVWMRYACIKCPDCFG